MNDITLDLDDQKNVFVNDKMIYNEDEKKMILSFEDDKKKMVVSLDEDDHKVIETIQAKQSIDPICDIGASNNQDGSSQVNSTSIHGNIKKSSLVERPDTRHKKENDQSNILLPLIIGDKVGSNNAFFPVLVELNKPSNNDEQAVNFKGDSGMIGRVSIMNNQRVHKYDTYNFDEMSKKRKVEEIEKPIGNEVSNNYSNETIRLDLKGDFYHGVMTNSQACICAVTVNPGKEAKIDFVFNHFLNTTYQGNVLEIMGGHKTAVEETKSEGLINEQ